VADAAAECYKGKHSGLGLVEEAGERRSDQGGARGRQISTHKRTVLRFRMSQQKPRGPEIAGCTDR
jgi:hypothetical protein